MRRDQMMRLLRETLEPYAMIRYEKQGEEILSLGNDHFLREVEQRLNQAFPRRRKRRKAA